MIKKHELIFLIKNYIIFVICWLIFESGISLYDNNILQIIGLINLLIHTILILGGEGVIYCILTIKNDSKYVFKILVISIIINICISIITRGVNSIIIYLSINQIIGTIIGRVIKIIKNWYMKK